jgi:hypothetical protein
VFRSSGVARRGEHKLCAIEPGAGAQHGHGLERLERRPRVHERVDIAERAHYRAIRRDDHRCTDVPRLDQTIALDECEFDDP